MSDAIVMATPLMEPSLSKETELLMNMKMAEYPTVNDAWIRNVIITSTPQNNQELEEEKVHYVETVSDAPTYCPDEAK